MTEPEVTAAAVQPPGDVPSAVEAPLWRPLSARQAGDIAWHETVFDGVPPHLGPSLARWVRETANLISGQDPVATILLRINRLARDTIVSVDPHRGVVTHAGSELEAVDVLLRCAELECSRLKEQSYLDEYEEHRRDDLFRAMLALRDMLDEAGSQWRLGVLAVRGGDTVGLVERVSEAAQRRASAVLDGQSTAAIHLSRAWAALYGRHPDYAKALDEAGRAIEAAAFPVICPQNTKATLTTAARELSDGAAKGKWTCAFGTLEQVAERMRAFYDAQQRHGVAEVADMNDVSREVAEAAVQEAITLVEWFRSGVIARVEVVA